MTDVELHVHIREGGGALLFRSVRGGLIAGSASRTGSAGRTGSSGRFAASFPGGRNGEPKVFHTRAIIVEKFEENSESEMDFFDARKGGFEIENRLVETDGPTMGAEMKIRRRDAVKKGAISPIRLALDAIIELIGGQRPVIILRQ